MSEIQEAPSVPELLDDLVNCHDSTTALIRQLGVPRSSFYHWRTGERFPHPEALSTIHRLAIQHELIAPDSPLPEQADQARQPNRDSEPMSRNEKVFLGTFIAGFAGLFAWMLWPVRGA